MERAYLELKNSLGKGEVPGSKPGGSTRKHWNYNGIPLSPQMPGDVSIRNEARTRHFKRWEIRGKISFCSEAKMIPRFYTETEVAARLHRTRRWFMDWIRLNPTDPNGNPLYAQLGRSKRFTGDDFVRIVDLILTQEEAGTPPRDGRGWIYFVDGGEHIKIGYSRSLQQRFLKMGTDTPGGAKVLHFEPGTFKSEKILHRHFSALRVRGEWFRKEPELLQFIEQRKLVGAHG